MSYRWDIKLVREKNPTETKAQLQRALTVAVLRTALHQDPDAFKELVGMIQEALVSEAAEVE